jgi:hypothetical protein
MWQAVPLIHYIANHPSEKGKSVEHPHYNLIDKKIYKKLTSSMRVTSVLMHTLFTRALYAVKSGQQNMSINSLLKASKENSIYDVFIEWAEEHTPYRYSPKKRKMVKESGGKWLLEPAFNNPQLTSEDSLSKEVKSFKNHYSLEGDSPIMLEDLENYLLEKSDRLHREIHLGIERNKSKLSAGIIKTEPEAFMASLKEKEKEIIRNYLKRNPAPDTVGPMGVPQSKYRYGTFGLNSMEYDVWRRP